MFTGPSYQTVSKHGDLCVYSDSMRTLVRTYKGQCHNRDIVRALYSHGLSAADKVAKENE